MLIDDCNMAPDSIPVITIRFLGATETILLMIGGA